MGILRIEADVKHLETVQNFVIAELEKANFSLKQIMQVEIAVEEFFCNIANYAYHPDKGDTWIQCKIRREGKERVEIEFIDEGIPYNPLEKEDPDISLSLEEREIGGLGIYLTKQLMDSMEYHHDNGRNILIITKKKED